MARGVTSNSVASSPMENSARSLARSRSFSLSCMVGSVDSSPAVPNSFSMAGPQYPFPETPAPGTATQVAPGVHWLRMVLPFQLDHINLWLLQDDGAWTIVDTGLGNAATREAWEKIFANHLGGKPVRR